MEKFTIDKEYELKINKETGHWDTFKNGSILSKTANKLYKFYSLELYNIEALLNHYFYLSNPGDFNDPFDCNVNLVEDIEGTEKLETVTRNRYRNVGITSFSELNHPQDN